MKESIPTDEEVLQMIKDIFAGKVKSERQSVNIILKLNSKYPMMSDLIFHSMKFGLPDELSPEELLKEAKIRTNSKAK
jgi:hypothetical protein